MDKKMLIETINHLCKLPKEEKKKLMNNAKSKRYYEKHKEQLRLRHLSYYKDNKDKINEQSKIYKEKNRDVLLEKKKKFYNENKKDILKIQSEKNKERILCSLCFKEICRASLTRHMSSTHPDDVLRGMME
jgi:uncharacterized membrane protein YheB (UPF0754 family)